MAGMLGPRTSKPYRNGVFFFHEPDDRRLGTVAEPLRREGGGGQQIDGVDIVGAFGSDQHRRLPARGTRPLGRASQRRAGWRGAEAKIRVLSPDGGDDSLVALVGVGSGRQSL